jgi:predicted permease
MPREPHIRGLRRWLRLPRAVERDVSDEISFHLESRIRELIDEGSTPDVARAIAEHEFGDISASRRELAAVDRRRMRRRRLLGWIEALFQDLRFAARSLRRSPSFTVTAVLTLAIGLGACAAIFAVVNGVLLRPLPYGRPDRLVSAQYDMPGVNLSHEPQSASTYFTNRRLAHTIEDIGVYDEDAVNVSEPGGSAPPQRVAAAFATASLFRLLEVPPIVGRAFTESEDRPDGPAVIVIGETMWRDRFAADTGIIGRTLDVNGSTRRIIGVMPRQFRLPAPNTQVWLPLAIDPVTLDQVAFSHESVARLKPGVTPVDAQRDFASVLPRVPELYPNFVRGITTAAIMQQTKPIPVIVPLQDDMTVGIASTLWMLAASTALLLFVACANVANLTLIRADARQRELAVREALGAGRARLVSQFFAESAILAGAAGVIGLAAAAVVVRWLTASGPAAIPRLAEVRIDSTTVVFMLVVATLVAAVCGLVPALRTAGAARPLAEGSRGGTIGRRQHRFRGALVAGQIAVSLVVVAASGLLLRSYQRLHTVRPGFDPEHVATFWMSLPRPAYNDDRIARFFANLTERASRIPGVQSAGLTSRLPLQANGLNQNPLYPEDDATYATKLPPLQLFTAANGEYFHTMRIPLVAGRTFDRLDAQRANEAIVSMTTAKQFWKDSTGEAALGKRFRPLPGAPFYTVIGVAGDVRDTALSAPPTAAVYFPEVAGTDAVSKQIRRTMALVLRTNAESAGVDASVRQIAHDIDPTIPVFDVKPMATIVSSSLARLTFVILVLGSAAVVTLLLGVVGLYGVLAYLVTLRTRELGIRMALGATPRRVASAMTRYGLTLAAIGLVVGLASFALVARFIDAQLFGVRASDPLTLGSATILLVVVAGAASWLPARRAARIDPADALRAE